MFKKSTSIYRLILKSSNHFHIKKEINNFIKRWNNLKLQVFIISKQKKLSILRAPFVHNKSREQFALIFCVYKVYFMFNYIYANLLCFINKYVLTLFCSQNLKRVTLKSKSYKF